MFAQLYMTIDSLITRVKRLHDRIYSLRGDDWTYRTTLPLPSPFIEVHMSCQEIEIACICVLVILILTLWTIFRRDFGKVPILCYFCSSFHCKKSCRWRDGPLKILYLSQATTITHETKLMSKWNQWVSYLTNSAWH